MLKTHIFLFVVILILGACQHENSSPSVNLLREFNPLNADGTVNVVIEISAGSNDKWEVNKLTGQLESDSIDGQPRKVNYLAYPANYGMVPKTLLPKEDGGDGDPLDVIVLGAAIERGNVAQCNIIGILKLLDNGEQDDKLLAVEVNSNFGNIKTLKSLEENYPNSTEILKLWFTNYKGIGKMEFLGFENERDARDILEIAISSYGEK